jgi:Ca-activated chloride channel family protein
VASEDASAARVFTVGIGTGVDKALLSRLASIKHGRFTFIADPRAVAAEFPKVLSQLEEPVLTDVTLRAEGGAIERVYPQALGDLFPADELRVFGRSRSRQPFKVVLEGNERGTKRRFETTVDPTSEASEPWVAQSWARARVDDLLEETSAKGESEELKNEAIELGLAYGLVTPYTSFLAIPEAELTEAAKTAVGSMRERRRRILTARTDAAALSRMNMPPGDPILRVHAPRDATRVTAMFPFGLSQDLAYDEMSECWMTRFLVPADVPDGTYEVRVVIILADGSVKVALAHYTIDSHEPSLDVEAKAASDGVDIRVMADEPALEVRVAAVNDLRNTRWLAPRSDRRTFEGHLALAPGHYRLRIVVADLARNESEREIDVIVPSHEAEPR